MGGGLMQLVAYGAQDIYLTGNPQITFFKVVYRRHTNFAVESIEQTINGSVGSGSKVSVTIARNGDLLSRVYVQLTGNSTYVAEVTAVTADATQDPPVLKVDAVTAVTESGSTGFDCIDYAEVEVGGQVIDKHYGAWMKIWCDLTHAVDKKTMLNDMLCNAVGCGCGTASAKTYIPLQFWFCRNPGLALPLIALQYHEVKLNIKFCNLSAGAAAEVWCDYIFLDTDERRRFAQVSHEYLIEQVQYNNGVTMPAGGTQTELRFNHPVKELVWQSVASSGGCACEKTGLGDVCSALLQLNGHDRFRKRDGDYFSTVQRYEHHSGARTAAATNNCVDSGEIYMYSFALKPEEHQPSGTCNFSRIDNAVLNVERLKTGTADGVLDVYAVNYNVLRIMSGMGGLAYSN